MGCSWEISCLALCTLRYSIKFLHRGGWKEELPLGADEDGADNHLDGRPDQHQVAHYQRGLIDQEVVGGEHEARYQ